MNHFKKLLVIFLTTIFVIPVYISTLFAEASETDKKAYLIMALPAAVPISQLDNSAIIDLRPKEAFKAYPIKGASNMDYNETLKAVEEGRLDNRALLFVYTSTPKTAYGQDMEETEGMETYQDRRSGRVGPIRRLIQFVTGLFGITPDESTEEGTGLEETPEIGGTTEDIPPIPPIVGDTSEEEPGDYTLPDEDNLEEDIEDITEGEDTILGENNNNNGLFPPLEEITMPTEEEDTSLTENNEEEGESEEGEGDSEEQQVIAANPLIGGGSGTGANQNTTMPVVGNSDTTDSSLGIGSGNDEETIVPAEPVNMEEEDNAQQTMSIETLTKELKQRGYNLTIIPFE